MVDRLYPLIWLRGCVILILCCSVHLLQVLVAEAWVPSAARGRISEALRQAERGRDSSVSVCLVKIIA